MTVLFAANSSLGSQAVEKQSVAIHNNGTDSTCMWDPPGKNNATQNSTRHSHGCKSHWCQHCSQPTTVTQSNVARLEPRSDPASTLCKTQITKHHVLVHCLEIQKLCPQVSTIVSSGTSCHPDVTIDHEALQPHCRGCDVPDTHSSSSHRNGTTCCCVQLDFYAGVENAVALTSTPCCCKTTPKSRNIETKPIPAAVALTAA